MYTERPLFGGAVACDILASWRDVSDVRQVPDHQECWQESGTDGSLLVVEILERQETDDANAARFFFNDLAESNGISPEQDCTFQPKNVSVPVQIEGCTPCMGVGFQKVAMGRDYDIAGNRRTNQEQKVIRVDLCVFRLPSVETDLLVSISTPVENPNEPPKGEASGAFERVLSSLRINDWQLFG